MKFITAILSQLLLIAKDARIWLRILVFVVIGTGCIITGAIVFSKTKKQDCSVYAEQAKYYVEQNKILLSALLKVQQIENGSPTSYIVDERNYLIHASNDTLPKQRAINRLIDSVLNKLKQDSLNRAKQKFKNK